MLFVLILSLLAGEVVYAQKFAGLDPSPADITYLRENGRR